jgi:phosphoribosylformylglycinamidine cyclo-ligase
MSEDHLTYRAAGVDIDAQDRAASLFAGAVRETYTDAVIQGLADFGGMFALRGYQEPVLVAGTDGVGTKLLIAFALQRHDTVGQDLVAMCVDDVVCQGARPLFFLDYLGSAVRDPEQTAAIVAGVAAACKVCGCALLGGEMAELPGLYRPGEYDLAGFAVGVVERSEIIDGSAVVAGDVLLGLASSGLHSNGYSLARKALLEVGGLGLDQHIPELGRTLGEELLEPTRLYTPALLAAFDAGLRPHGIAHITGGGLPDNTRRCIPEGLCAYVDCTRFPTPPVFELIARLGNVERPEMYRTFNMGIGMVLVVAPEQVGPLTEVLQAAGETVYCIGHVAPGAERVVLAYD